MKRGITLASNVGKVFERIINERVRTKVKMSENQAGGKKNSATTDHILILQTAIKEMIKKNGVYGFPRYNKSLWQGLARCNHVCHAQGRTKHPRLEHSEKTERKPRSKNPCNIWRNKSNQHQRQYTTGQSPISSTVCTANGRNKQGNKQT